jgi:ribosome biogenesis GTPase
MAARDKHKGTGEHALRRGLGQLRRANAKDVTRLGGWERRAEDDDYLDRHGGSQHRSCDAGERLLSRFNRLVALGLDVEQPGEPGEISEVRAGQVIVRLADGSELACQVMRALVKRMRGVSNALCAGDRVRVSRGDGGPAVVGVEPRVNELARADSHNRSLRQVVAANLDLVLVVGSLGEPPFRPGLVDRYLLLAAAGGIPAALVINKLDLGEPAPWLALYRGLGIAAIATDALAPGDPGVAEVGALLAGRRVVVAGQSGVGKTSLVNALFPGLGARVGTVAEEGFGRHTTTAARAYPVAGGGVLIDTPGIRECAIIAGGFGPVDVALLFPDFAALQPQCRFPDCSHRHEPDCAVLAALEAGNLAPTRYDSYRSIVDEDLA